MPTRSTATWPYPIEPTSDWQTAIAAMVRAFEAAGRTPRLEFFAELWPDLPSALEAAGFVPERRGEVMAMEAFALRPAPSPVQPRLLDGNAPRSLLAAFLARAGEAFGEAAAIQAPGELERFAHGCAGAPSGQRRCWRRPCRSAVPA